MKLVATPEEIDKYSRLGILKIKAKNEYFLSITDLKGTAHSIDVSMDLEPTMKPSHKVLEYDKYWDAFPTPSDIKKALVGIGVQFSRNLRTGSREVIQKRLIKLSKNYSPKDILDTINYEVQMRIKESLATNKNKFDYMKGAEPWSNDEGNISTMFSEMQSSSLKDFPQSSNNKFNDDFNFV